MSRGPMQSYRELISSGAIASNPEQAHAIEKLQMLAGRLHDYNPATPKRISFALFGWGRERLLETQLPGLYLYGAAGRGKSMLMDLFFKTAPISPKRRVHFHAFMQEVHSGIADARRRGADDPVIPVADAVADQASLLCFDEMQITDITDAMLVGRLFERLFARGVVVVATSNRHPDALYEGGWNRDIFLPFIQMIKSQMEVHELASPVDYRRARVPAECVYHTPTGTAARQSIDALWARLTGTAREAPMAVTAHGRTQSFQRAVDRMLRADFTELCVEALGSAEYLALASAIDILVLENVPILSRKKNNEAKRFITLIDTLYEARVKLVISADAEPDALYIEGEGSFEFGRTASRLEEMRSQDWWSDAAHDPVNGRVTSTDAPS